MNRQRYVPRIFVDDNDQVVELTTGTERGVGLGAVLASMLTDEELETLINHVAAVNEFGGEFYFSAIRRKFNSAMQLVRPQDPGSWKRVGSVLHYSKRSQIKGEVQEPDVERGSIPAPPLDEGAELGSPPEAPPEPAPAAMLEGAEAG